MHFIRIIVVVFFVLALPVAGKTSPVSVANTDKCPVCGMFVAKYPDFLAQIIFTDNSYAVFDGVKDLFKYYLDLRKYNSSKTSADIAFIYVTDYYGMALIDGKTAKYVIGSDVFGPMGKELIPFAEKAAADEFLNDHSGKKIVHFDDVTPELLNELN